jgi:hypothetical protein
VTFGGNGFSRGDNLVIFYYFSTLNSSLIKRGDLWWEWPLKRGQFSDILLFQYIEF